MSLRTCCTVAGISLLLAALPLRADPAADYPYYGGFALGFASADSNCDYYGYNCDGTDTTFKIYAGKRVHRNLALEVAFHDLGKLRNEGFSESTTAESQGVNLSLLGIIPVSDYGFFYGKAGYMAWNADYTRNNVSSSRSDEDGSDFTYGAGFAFTFSPDYDFRIEFERLNDLGDDYVPGGAPIEVLYFSGSINFQ
ncbi:outer membrane beta-barrel protein [Gammaproteobacteria bacterium]|nr:outer membrane beta-barrel protein [Gammaproteobacteria bacterium]